MCIRDRYTWFSSYLLVGQDDYVTTPTVSWGTYIASGRNPQTQCVMAIAWRPIVSAHLQIWQSNRHLLSAQCRMVTNQAPGRRICLGLVICIMGYSIYWRLKLLWFLKLSHSPWELRRKETNLSCELYSWKCRDSKVQYRYTISIYNTALTFDNVMMCRPTSARGSGKQFIVRDDSGTGAR